ncbi:MAG: AAA family ATPase [Candidatus Eremiobacteraeota bacterium]|nr:AAA family ATPase [Candidatus Eremiobacteraeota bacterium]
MVGRSLRCRRFVGRVDELGALEKARKSLGKSSGSFALISGEAGIGKTRLLTEFLEGIENRRARNLINTECLQKAQQPFGPVRALLRALAPKLDFERLPPTALRTLIQFIPEHLPHGIVSTNDGFSLEKEPLLAGVFELLQIVCAKRATILTVEDIHWADGSTLDFLQYIARRIRHTRLLVVATYRSDERGTNDDFIDAIAPLLRESTLQRIELEPLRRAEVRALVEGVVDGKHCLLEPAVLDIERLSEGNPFFAEELVNHYLERSAAKSDVPQLPLSIRASIVSRLKGLTREELRILKRAAVLGQRFDPDVLAVVMGCDRAELSPALRRARELNFLSDGTRTRLSCRFKHALTRQTVYEEIPVFEARELHRQILRVLEKRADAAGHTEELAYHAWESGDVEKCLYYNERAGEETFALRALPEASVCFERALQAASEPDDRARILERIGAVARLLGHYEVALDTFNTALAIRLERREFDAAALLAHRVTGQRCNLGDVTGALTFVRSFLQEFGPMVGDGAKNQLLVTAARTASALYDMPAAQEFIDEVVNPQTLPPSARQNFLIVQLMRHAYFGNAEGWKRSAQDVAELLSRLAPDAAVEIESALALTGIYVAENRTVELALQHAGRLEREWDLRGPRVYKVAVEAAYLYQRGKLREARACVEEVISNADVLPALLTVMQFAVHVADALGDTALWTAFIEERARRAGENRDELDEVFFLAAYAGSLASGGDVKRAASYARFAVDALKYGTPDAMFVLINAARILPRSDLERTVRLASEAARSGNEVALATEALVSATIASRFGTAEESQALGRTAAARYAAFSWPLLEAAAREVAGDIAEAERLYQLCGADAYVRRLSASPTTECSDPFASLTSRESEIVRLAAKGATNSEIAKSLSIGSKTVEKHLSSVYEKLGLRSRSQVAALVTSGSSARSA